jgi:Ca-activated chloride channel family protein
VRDIEPPAHPDLFADRPVVLFGKYEQPTNTLPATITVSGTQGGDRVVRQQFTLNPDPGKENQPLRTLWARQRLARISDFAASSADTREEIAELGLGYNLLTSETSFVAVLEEVRNPAGKADDVKQPLPLPHKVSNLAVGGKKTPEPEFWLLCLCLAGFFVITNRRQLAVLFRKTA